MQMTSLQRVIALLAFAAALALTVLALRLVAEAPRVQLTAGAAAGPSAGDSSAPVSGGARAVRE